MTPTRTALHLAGVLELCEAVCRFYGFSLEDVCVSNPRTRARGVRNVMYGAMSLRGWTEDSIAHLFNAKLPAVEAALDDVREREARRFVPRKAS